MTQDISPAENAYTNAYETFSEKSAAIIKENKENKALEKLNELFLNIDSPSPALLEEIPAHIEQLIKTFGNRNGSANPIVALAENYVKKHKAGRIVAGNALIKGADSMLTGSVYGDYSGGFPHEIRLGLFYADKGLELNKGQLNDVSTAYLAKTFNAYEGWSECKGLYKNFSKEHTQLAANKRAVADKIIELSNKHVYLKGSTIEGEHFVPVNMVSRALELSTSNDKAAVENTFNNILSADNVRIEHAQGYNIFIESAIQKGLLFPEIALEKLKEKVERVKQVYYDPKYQSYSRELIMTLSTIDYVGSHDPDYLLTQKDFILVTAEHSRSSGYYLLDQLKTGQPGKAWNAVRPPETVARFNDVSCDILEDAARTDGMSHYVNSYASAVVRLSQSNPERSQRMIEFMESHIETSASYIIKLANEGFVPNADDIYQRHDENKDIRTHVEDKKNNKLLETLGI